MERKIYIHAVTTNSPLTPQDQPDENLKRLLKAVQECPGTVAGLEYKTEIESLKTQLAEAKVDVLNLLVRLANAELLYRRELEKSIKSEVAIRNATEN